MTEDNEQGRQLAALHKHWVIADSVNYHLRRSIETTAGHRSGLPDAMAQAVRQTSVLAAVSLAEPGSILSSGLRPTRTDD
jgi:hypothetical protein